MIMRITWGKLRAGCWQEYEQALQEPTPENLR